MRNDLHNTRKLFKGRKYTLHIVWVKFIITKAKILQALVSQEVKLVSINNKKS